MGAVTVAVGGVVSVGVLATVMVTGAEGAVLPLMSRAMAVRVWVPLARVVVLRVAL